MATGEYPFVIGTAGHIDHGKTALVRALSGVDCDRLTEEKKRGMTIELGFAPLLLPSGKTVSIVDVPGHEKFIRQMVAGAAGIDAVMLVIAADDGVMPQTKEHLEILTLLGIKNGITVINKVDLVDEEMLELAKDDVISLISGTFLEGCPIVPVSAMTGEGLQELKNVLQHLVDSTTQKSRKGAFFLPVDRAFHISGFGTVVTGTAFNGVLCEGDELEVLPAKTIAKVRSIQVHGESVQSASAGQRVAVNLANVSLENVRRGDVIAAKGHFSPTECIDVKVRVLRSFPEALEHWQRLRLHVGTSDVVVRISLLDRDKIAPGECAVAQLLPEEPLTVSLNSRFILRTYSPLHTVAGGVVLLPLGERPKNKATKGALIKYLTEISGDTDSKEWLRALLEYKGMIKMEDLLFLMEADISEIRGNISSLEMKGRIGVIKTTDTTIVSMNKLEELRETLLAVLAKFHKDHPERKGMDFDEAGRALSISEAKFIKELLKLMQRLSWITIDDDRVRLNDFAPFDESLFLANVSAVRDRIKAAGYSMPTIEETSSILKISQSDMTRIIAYMKERKELVIIGAGFLLLSEIAEDFRDKLKSIDGDITLAVVRDLTGSSRKYSLPLLEYFDSKGITRRVGDKRILLKK